MAHKQTNNNMNTNVAPLSNDYDDDKANQLDATHHTNHDKTKVGHSNRHLDHSESTIADTTNNINAAQIETVELDPPTAHATSTNIPVPDEEDDLFDSDEQVDVESISSSDDDDPGPLPQSTDSIPSKQYLGKPLPRSQTHTQPSTTAQKPRSSESASTSLFLRASQTFYKTFIKRKTGSTDRQQSSAPTAISENTGVKACSLFAASTTDDQNERLCRLLDAQLSALAGAKKGFVQLEVLRIEEILL